MALPIITVPQYPNVPDVPGVPPLARAAIAAQNVLGARILGTINALDSTFIGTVVGDISQANGLIAPLAGTMRGVIDTAKNVTATLSGNRGGAVVGAITGTASFVSGLIDGYVSGIVDALTGAEEALVADGPAVQRARVAQRWGLYLNGTQALVPDSIFAFEFTKDYKISSYPIEGGGFESYNKVEIPAEPRLMMTKGGTESARAEFLAQVRALVPDLQLYDIVTPTGTFSSMTVRHWDFSQRADQGANMLMIELILEEVRVTATAAFTNTAQPQGEASQNGGPVQARPLTEAELKAVLGKVTY